MYLGKGRGLPNPKPERLRPDPLYLEDVRKLPCLRCGIQHGIEAHHCRDKPLAIHDDIYKRIPGAARKSHDHDAIPLCVNCHWLFHNRRSTFHEDCGKDYMHILATREAVERMREDEILGRCL